MNVCEGDSGGGLYFQSDDKRYYVRGVVSLTGKTIAGTCELRNYALFTKVSKYLPWIETITRRVLQFVYSKSCTRNNKVHINLNTYLFVWNPYYDYLLLIQTTVGFYVYSIPYMNATDGAASRVPFTGEIFTRIENGGKFKSLLDKIIIRYQICLLKTYPITRTPIFHYIL